jgi:hypothetical protein
MSLGSIPQPDGTIITHLIMVMDENRTDLPATCTSSPLRRLRDRRPDLHEHVMAKELSGRRR